MTDILPTPTRHLEFKSKRAKEMDISVEYLAIFRRTDSYCDSKDGFVSLLKADSQLTVEADIVSIRKQTTAKMNLSFGTVTNKPQRYFHVTFTWFGNPDTDTEDLNRFTQLLKTVRGVIEHAGGELETLRDDIASHYSRKAYPLIHDIEIQMRRLIANFMLVRIGREWVAEALPGQVKEANQRNKQKLNDGEHSEKTKQSPYLNVLQTYDFIHLGQMLFNEYSTKPIPAMYQQIRDASSIDDLTAIKEFLPLSNWKRYFASLIKCDSDYLEKRWKRLYELRCMVAHNSPMTARDVSEIETLVSEVRPKLINAIEKLHEVTVPPSEVERIAESVARSASPSVDAFFVVFHAMESAILQRLYSDSKGDPDPSPPNDLLELGLLDTDRFRKYHAIRNLRNQIVHGAMDPPSEESLHTGMSLSREIVVFMEDHPWYFDFKSLSPGDRHSKIEDMLSDVKDDLLNEEEVINAMAETDAFGFNIDDIDITEVFDGDDECVARIRFVATGEHKEGIDFGNRILGAAEAIITWDGDVEFREVCAERDWGERDEEDEFDPVYPDDFEDGEDYPDRPQF